MPHETYMQGAADERVAILRYLNREKRESFTGDVPLVAVIDWIKKRHERYNVKAGGMGRKGKKK